MIPRRAALGLGAATLVAGCGLGSGAPNPEFVPDEGDGCRTPGELVSFDNVAGAQLLYADGDTATSMRAEPGFLTQLEAWAADWTELSGLGAMHSITSFGAYVDKCHSYHQIGQAFDITHVAHERGEVSLRFDHWSPGSPEQLRNYWRLAASIHLHFAYTLAYPHNVAHHNHIHFDNMVSGSEASEFLATSKAQVHLVQHAAKHVFGHGVEATGEYDQQTRNAVRAIQRAQGLTQPLREQAGWQGFLRAVVRGN